MTPPDAHGFCSLGTSVEAMHAAIRAAKMVIAQFNSAMPRTLGDSFIHVSQIDLAVEVDVPPYEHAVGELGDVQRRIGEFVADLVPDGATLQLGIGGIPAATALALRDKRDLGIHTEMFTDAVVDLVEAGVITGARKERNPGKLVTAFLMGTKRLYDFVHDNPMVEMRPVDFTNDTHVIRGFSRMTAINSAIEIDLTGQVVADSIGPRMYSGIGGQMDFMRGAGLAAEGRAIIALPSTAAAAQPRASSRSCKRVPASSPPAVMCEPSSRNGGRGAVRQDARRAGAGPHRHRPSRLPRGAHLRGTRAPPDLTVRAVRHHGTSESLSRRRTNLGSESNRPLETPDCPVASLAGPPRPPSCRLRRVPRRGPRHGHGPDGAGIAAFLDRGDQEACCSCSPCSRRRSGACSGCQ